MLSFPDSRPLEITRPPLPNSQGSGSGQVVAVGGWYPSCKRAGEFVFALVLLLLTLPLLLLAMALVKLTSRGPALYTQTRVGRGGRPFTLYKIRSMAYQAEDLTGATWSPAGDNRVTAVGRWLRRSHVDELPQLWNVLRGDMSLIGPRPERPEFVPQLEQALPWYGQRLLLRPGLTGLAQVQLPPDTDLDSVRRKLAYDLYYLHHASWWLDWRIGWATVLHMVGVPFATLRHLFGFPKPADMERACQFPPAPMYFRLTANGQAEGNGTAETDLEAANS